MFSDPRTDHKTGAADMLTREQWEALAKFACVDENTRNYGWYPRSDWNDFGPLWVKLERWVATNNKTKSSYDLFDAYDNFYTAKHYGTESELMEAGCALGAVIGATMGDKA